MKLITQENRYSCVVCAFAMASARSVNDLIVSVGHDGSEIMFPDSDHPWRGFHVQEMILALIDEFSITEIGEA